MSHGRLDLSMSDRGLALYQQRFYDEQLPAALSSASFARFKKKQYSLEDLQWGQATWELRTLDEYRSQVGFTEYLSELTELGCSFDILSCAVRVVRDEARHVELCRRLVLTLGGTDIIPGEPVWVISDKSQPLMTRILQTTVSSLCIGETLSTALLAATRDKASDSLAKHVLTQLTRDESFHGQFGWMLFKVLWAEATKKAQRHILKELPEILKLTHEAVFENAVANDANDPRSPFGHLKYSERTNVFEESLEKHVLARFDQLDVPVRSMWEEVSGKKRGPISKTRRIE
jgi:hypothetical protein